MPTYCHPLKHRLPRPYPIASSDALLQKQLAAPIRCFCGIPSSWSHQAVAMQSALSLPSHIVRSCRLIAGRRYAPSSWPTSSRYFHQSLLRQSRPSPESNGSPDANHDTPSAVKPAGANTQSEQDRDTASLSQSSAGRKSYISGLRRTWKDKKSTPEDTPVAATIPQWFIDQNVVTYGQVGGLESPTPLLVDIQQQPQKPSQLSDGGVNKLQTSSPEPLNENGSNGAPEPAVGGGRYIVSSDSWEKLQAAAKAGFMFPSAKYADDPTTERSHLLLRYPGNDGIDGTLFLNAVVQRLAKDVEANLVTLNAQDIARLCSEQERAEGGAVSSIRNLGYEVYSDWKRPPKPDVSSEWSDRDDGAADDVESSFSIPGSGARPRIVSVESNLPDTQLPNWLLSLTGAGADSTSSRASRTETGTWLRIINQLMSLSSQSKPASSNDASEATNEADRGSKSQPKTIIHIQDYLEVAKSREGSKFLRLFLKTLHGCRRQGQSILLIGTSSQPRNTSADMTRAKKVNEQMSLSVDSSAVPFGFPLWVVPAMESTIVDRVIAEDRKSHTRQTNIRHLQDMIRKRVDHDAIPIDEKIFDAASWPMDTDIIPELRLDSHYWYFSRVHHHITLAMGSVEPNETFGFKHIRQASTIRERNIGIRDEWVEGSTSDNPDTPGANTNSKVDAALQLGCNRYEKKLLSGVVKAGSIRTTFADVHVPPGTVEALKTLTSLSLIRPDAFTYGVLATDKIPGMLLYGPPGTGKTLLAKAVARESGATVLEISGSDVYDMYVGEGEKNVRAIFTLAKKLSPCVVFIDEADAIFGSRNQGRNRPSSHRELINQFLREWDGMNDMSAFIMVATNRPFDLDDAVLRRLPRRLLVDLPTEQDRESILKIHLSNEQIDPSVDLSDLAHRSPFYSGSDLKNVCVAAALTCVREEYEQAAKHTGDTPYQYPERRVLTKAHFERAMEEISASISEDMSSLDAIRKFDEKYGDRKGRRKKNAAWGFMPMGDAQTGSDSIRVRT